MALADATGLVAGAVALGFVHGIEPGHGWPVAASYALDQSNKWLYGFAASLLLGVGHLVSSIAMVLVFFWAKSYFSLTQVNEPISVAPGVEIGGPVSLVAGVLLVLLGVREYRHGHSHSHDHGGDHDAHDHDARDPGDVGKFDHAGDHSHGDGDHSHGDGDHSHGDGDHSHGDGDHSHGDGDHSHDHGDHSHDHGDHDHSHPHDDGDHSRDRGLLARVKTALPFVGGHSHGHGSMADAADRGLWGIAGFAFLLGFAHEEEFEIIAICAGSQYCLELMLIYAATVVFGIVGLTLLLIAGYERSEERVRAYADYLPAFSAAVLVIMGVGFVAGLF